MAAAASVSITHYSTRDQIVLENLDLVKTLAVSLHQSLPANVDLEDLVQVGILGLFGAIDHFHPEMNVPFPRFARHRVRGAMLDSLRKLDWASRSLRRRQRDVAQATHELEAVLNRAPSGEEIAAKLGIDMESWHKMIQDFRSAQTYSASTTSDEDSTTMDFPCKPEMHPDEICSHSEMHSALDIAMEKLPRRYRTVMGLYYKEHVTMRRIGLMMGLNESRVSQIHKAALKKMRATLEVNGVPSVKAF